MCVVNEPEVSIVNMIGEERVIRTACIGVFGIINI